VLLLLLLLLLMLLLMLLLLLLLLQCGRPLHEWCPLLLVLPAWQEYAAPDGTAAQGAEKAAAPALPAAHALHLAKLARCPCWHAAALGAPQQVWPATAALLQGRQLAPLGCPSAVGVAC
jgi:hypothetical protein